MLIYAGTKSDFMMDTENDCLETKLYENIKLKMNRTTGLSELNAWRNSLKEMYIILNDSDIPKDAGVAIEYNIPQTSKRIDFLTIPIKTFQESIDSHRHSAPIIRIT